MKLTLSIAALVLTSAITFAALYEYPHNKKPAVSLPEACDIATAMVKSQRDEKRYHYTGAYLMGDGSESGDGYWNIYLFDTDENQIEARIPLQESVCSLHYFPHDYSTNGGDRAIDFSRNGTKVTVPGKE